jgi:hypothetical protein
MSVSVVSLIAQTRLDSGLRNNTLFSDAQIAGLLTDAYADLRDKLIVRFAYWFKAEPYEFTLGNGEGNNVLDLSLVPDFQMAQGLDLLNGDSQPTTVDMLDSFASRNQYNNTFPFATVGQSFNGFTGRRYWIDGDTLTVYPSANAAGNYRLIYTPMLERLQLPTTVSWDLVAAANASDNSGTIQYNFGSADGDHPAFVDAMLGGTLTVFFFEPNHDWSCTDAVITGPDPYSAGNSAHTTVAWPGGSFTSPVAASTASITYQEAGTRADLPQVLTPWSKYLVLYASLAIRASRRQPAGDLELQFQQMSQRVTAATKQRSEGVRQAPIIRGWGSGGWGGGYR